MRRRYVAFTPLLLASALGYAGDTQQDQQSPAELKKLSLEALSQIDVTSPSRTPTPVFRSPVAIYVITGEDIRRSGATTLPEALRLAPGVEVARIDGSKWSVGIRGFGTRLSRDVLVLIDGRTVYTPLFAGTYWEVQDTLLEDIDRIEVIRGPGGTIWGPNAVNGVINIITKSSKDTKGAYASVAGGNEEQAEASARYGGGSGDFSYRAYAKGYTRGPEHHFDHDNFDDWRGGQAGFRMDWGSASADSFTVQGDLYKQEDGERVALATYVPAFSGTIDGDAEASGGNVLARWTHKFKDGDDVQVQTYYDRTNRLEPNFGEDRDTFDIDVIAHRRLGSRHRLTYGLGSRFSDGRFIETTTGLVFSPLHYPDYLVSGFLQDEVTLVSDKLYLTAGSKILRTNFTSHAFEPSLRLMWTPSQRNTFWVSYTHAVRTPSRGEESFYLSSYLGPGPGGVPSFARFNPNADFAPEQLNGYEAGYRTLITKSLYVDVTGFWNHYHDLFSQDLAGPLSLQSGLPFPGAAPPSYYLLPAQFRNDLYGFTAGFEIAPEWRPTSFWRLRPSYSFLNMNLSKAPGTALGETPEAVDGSSPRHQVGVQSSFDLSRAIQLDLGYRYVSAAPAQNAPAYSTGDVRLAWRFHPRLEFSVTGRNLLQPYHVEFGADPGGAVAIVRSVYATLAWRK